MKLVYHGLAYFCQVLFFIYFCYQPQINEEYFHIKFHQTIFLHIKPRNIVFGVTSIMQKLQSDQLPNLTTLLVSWYFCYYISTQPWNSSMILLPKCSKAPIDSLGTLNDHKIPKCSCYSLISGQTSLIW